MSLTLAIDDEIGTLLRDEAEKTGRSAADVAATLLRAALQKPKVFSPVAFHIQPHAGTFAPGVETSKLNQLAGELEVEVFLDKQLKGA